MGNRSLKRRQSLAAPVNHASPAIFQYFLAAPPGETCEAQPEEQDGGRLRNGEEVLGDNGQPVEAYEESATRVVLALFGPEFVAGLDELAVGGWEGPVKSRFGLHLVQLEERVPGELPELSAVRGRVEREWAREKQAEARRRYDEKLLGEFEVVHDWSPEDVAGVPSER